MNKKLAYAWLTLALLVLVEGTAGAATLSVGPGQTYAKIMDAWAMVQPGDVIEVQGGQTYTGTFLFDSDHSGTPKAPITVKGILVNGQRPILRGVGPGMWDTMVVLLNANHFVMESFEIAGDDTATDECLFHKADDVTLRDLVVHDCLQQAGLVGGDDSSGSITVEYSEFYHNGYGEYSHQIYMATDQSTYPGSTFRLQYCYIHDGVGGNNVASRAQRNEIYYNWIEGAYYHELDLIGPDTGAPFSPCNSDIVGNVFVKTSEWRVARIGGDAAENSSNGQYRFVNNTMVLAPQTTAAITLQYTVASVEMHNNVIVAPTAGTKIYDIEEPMGAPAVSSGSDNWITSSMTNVPMPWTMTVMGSDPGFVDPSMHDLRPQPKSPLVGAGTTDTAVGGAMAFPNPLMLPAFNPPERRLIPVGSAEARSFTGNPSIGAFEPTAAQPGPPPPGVGGAPTLIGGGADSGGNGNGTSGGCKCRTSSEPDTSAGLIAGLGVVALAVGRRRRRA